MLGVGFSTTTLAVRRGPSLPAVAALSPVAWYDPSDRATLFQDAAMTVAVAADGDPVGAMRDKSGNGFHMTQSTAASRPVYRAAGGRHWLDFDGVDDQLANAMVSTAQPTLIAVALNIESGADYATLFGGGSGGRNDIRIRSIGAIEAYAGNILSTASAVATKPTGPVVISGLFYGSASAIHFDGSQVAAGDAGSQLLSGAYIGGRYDGTLPVDMGFFGAVLLVSGDDATRTKAEIWLARKSGAAL